MDNNYDIDSYIETGNLIGHKAPNFTAKAVMPGGEIRDIELHKYIAGKRCVLFFYPLDFTFVCPTELLAANSSIQKFYKLNTIFLAVSIDSVYTHLAYSRTPVNQGGIGKINYPLISDLSKSLSHSYGVICKDGETSLRATIVIDEQGIVRRVELNDLPIGRNMDDTLRFIEALDFYNEHGEVCPAGWKPGQSGIHPSTEGIKDYLSSYEDGDKE